MSARNRPAEPDTGKHCYKCKLQGRLYRLSAFTWVGGPYLGIWANFQEILHLSLGGLNQAGRRLAGRVALDLRTERAAHGARGDCQEC